MHPPSPVQGLRQKVAIGAVDTMEEKMRVLTINELLRLTRIELCGLAAKITALPTLREGSPQRTAAYINLRKIRASWRDASSRPDAKQAPPEQPSGSEPLDGHARLGSTGHKERMPWLANWLVSIRVGRGLAIRSHQRGDS
jgi:hypothetical protein